MLKFGEWIWSEEMMGGVFRCFCGCDGDLSNSVIEIKNVGKGVASVVNAEKL